MTISKQFLTLMISTLFIMFIMTLADTAKADESVVVVIDTSGSMKDVGPKVKEALREFIDGIKQGTHLSLVRFDVFSEILAQFKLESNDEKQHVKAIIESLMFKGPKTNFDEAIKGAEVGLFRTKQLQNGTILVISDGISDPSRGKDVMDLVNLSQKVFPQGDGYNIYLIGISQNSTPSKNNIGNVTQIHTPKQGLGEVLDYIQNQSQSVLPSSATKNSNDTSSHTLSVEEYSPLRLNMNWIYGVLAILLIASISVYWMIRRGMLRR